MQYRLLVPNINKLKYLTQCPINKYSSKVPNFPYMSLEKDQCKEVILDRSTLTLLERLSLVKYNTPEGLKVLKDSIDFANKVLHIKTTSVEPLYSVLEEENLSLRSDEITQGNCQNDVLKNASLKEDDYFIAPIGNIPLHEVEIEEISTTKTEIQ